MPKQEISIDSIKKGLENIGITKGDNIVMHSNLRSLGKARELVNLPNCGADTIIDAILDIIGPEGLLCVPTFTATFLPTSSGPSGEVFDPQTTPSRVGSITNILRERQDSVRSLHPTHSWAVVGEKAEEFVSGHENTSTFGRDATCGRMYDWNFKILWFGTTGQTNTSTHFAEDWLDLPYMTSEDVLVKDNQGFRTVTVFRSPSGPRDFYSRESKLDAKLEEWDIQKRTTIHRANVTVMNHPEFMDNLLRALIDDPCLLLQDNRDDKYHSVFYKLNIEYMEHRKKQMGGAEGILSELNCGK